MRGEIFLRELEDANYLLKIRGQSYSDNNPDEGETYNQNLQG